MEPSLSPPPRRRTPWWLLVLLLIGALVGAQYLGCPVMSKSEKLEWVE